jgi:translation initiation factor 4G
MMTVDVRPASTEDARFLGWTILAAGRAHLPRGWYDIALGLPEAGCLEVLSTLVLTHTPSFWNYSNFLVAEVDGEPAAALCGFGARTGWGQAETAMAEALSPMGWRREDIAAVWTRGAYVFTCAEETQGDPWVIENVATRPERRGLGLAVRLIEASLEKARGQGFDAAQLSFVIGNESAERAYTKAGFHLQEERRHPDFEAAVGAPGLKRFGRSL